MFISSSCSQISEKYAKYLVVAFSEVAFSFMLLISLSNLCSVNIQQDLELQFLPLQPAALTTIL